MTHLLPPNLLKLFAPRAPLPYARPVGRDAAHVRKKHVSGVADMLARVQEEAMMGIVNSGKEDMEEGEEEHFTHAEEVRRQIAREERKKKREERFKTAKENCQCLFLSINGSLYSLLYTDKPAENSQATGDPYKTLFISRLVSPFTRGS